MNCAIAQAPLKSLIDREFPFHEVQWAYHYLQSEVYVGKVVITI